MLSKEFTLVLKVSLESKEVRSVDVVDESEICRTPLSNCARSQLQLINFSLTFSLVSVFSGSLASCQKVLFCSESI